MRKKEPVIRLNKEEKEDAKELLKAYLSEHFDLEIGNLPSEMLLDFITEKIGGYYYNRAVEDAIGFMAEKTEDLYLLMK
ncbi:MAG: DUF2164 domain-containing protein [Clostridiales bacterium]|nr:DUF2164 domain-containing protein [Clostridiales bacterium]